MYYLYDLSCGDMNNKTIKEALEKHLTPELLKKYQEVTNLSLFICSRWETDDYEKYFNELVATLTCGQYLDIDNYLANVLYFAAIVNKSYFNRETQVFINSITRAQQLYELCSRDYQNVIMSDIKPKTTQRYTTPYYANHSYLWPECNIIWRLPIAFYGIKQKDGTVETHILLGPYGETNRETNKSLPAYVTILGQEYAIPRVIYIQFFKDYLINGRVDSALSTGELKGMLDERDINKVKMLLDYCGFINAGQIECIRNARYWYNEKYETILAQVDYGGILNEPVVEEGVYGVWWPVDSKERPNTYKYGNSKILPSMPVNGIITIYKES